MHSRPAGRGGRDHGPGDKVLGVKERGKPTAPNLALWLLHDLQSSRNKARLPCTESVPPSLPCPAQALRAHWRCVLDCP